MRTWEDYKKTMRTEDEVFSHCRTGNLDGIKKSIQLSRINDKDFKGYSPLMLAAYHGHLDCVNFLLALGADPNSSEKSGNTTLMGAAFKGHADVVKQLVAFGADISVRNPKGQTALQFAQMFGRTEVVHYLQSLNQKTGSFGWKEILSSWTSYLFNRRSHQ